MSNASSSTANSPVNDADLSSAAHKYATQVAQNLAPQATPPADGQAAGNFETEEVRGDVVVPGPNARDDDEVANSTATETMGESTAISDYIEASPEQLAAAESASDTAVSDLMGIEGFQFARDSSESAGEATTALREAGTAISGEQPEFFGAIISALAPTLISSVGPSIARAVVGRLSPRARRVVERPITQVRVPARPGSTSSPLPMLINLLQQALARPGGEAEPEEATALVEEAAAILEVIIGTDDRVRITNTTAEPWRRICALRITFPSGATFRGSGFFIGKRAVATAGHCVYMKSQGGWAKSVVVIPGANGSARPFGQVTATSFRSVVGWVTHQKPESDYGCIILPAGSFGGGSLGAFGIAALSAQELLAVPAVLAGYPGDKPFAEMWGMARKIKAVNATTLVYDIDTYGGQSGTCVYINRNGQRKVVGIHNYGAANGNSATRVTVSVAQRLAAWSQL